MIERTGQLIFLVLVCLYLLTGGGKGYSVDGAFGYEMAKTVFLDPSHDYFRRFRTAFARWGGLMPLLGQPFVLAGDLVARIVPERDALWVNGHQFRVEEWPPLAGTQRAAPPLPTADGRPRETTAVAVVSFLSDSVRVPQGTVVGWIRLWSGGQLVTLPIRAGVDTAEWAHDRPDVAGTVAHDRPRLAGHWIGQPRGNLYYTRLTLPAPMAVERWELSGGEAGATWHVRAVAFEHAQPPGWTDVHTGERFWSARQTRDFFTRLAYSTINAFTTAATAALVYALARRFGFAIRTSAVAALGYGVATMAWPYAKLDFSEPAATCFALLAIWVFYRVFPPTPQAPTVSSPTSRRSSRFPFPGAPGRRKRLGARSGTPKAESASGAASTAWYGVMAGAALFAAVLGKYTAALFGGALVAQWAVSSGWWRPEARGAAVTFLGALVLPALGLGALAVVALAALTGEVPIVLFSGIDRLAEDWLALPLWTGLRGLLFSPGKSLFLYSPWLLLAVPGSVLLLRRFGRHAAIFVVFPALVVLLYGMKLVWHGGGWGPRYLLPIVPLLCVTSAPALDWLLSRGRRAQWALATVALASVGVQLLAVGKDPEQYPSMVREFVVPALPDLGSRLGGRDYWVARGGEGLERALLDPDARGAQRGLGYLWGYPTAELTVEVREPRDFRLALYFVDWDRQDRRQAVTVEDAGGIRRLDLDRDFAGGTWAAWEVAATPQAPVRVTLEQKGRDTAVLSAAAFDRPRGTPRTGPDMDERTAGNWRGVYGADGYVLFAFRSFNVDAALLPPYVSRYELAHVGDKDDPRIHVEIAQQDLLDTPLLYAAPFSPLLGNAWLLAADTARLLLPGRPDLVEAVLARPPWTWFGIAAPLPAHPEYGLGLDFWPTLLYTNYASHPGVLAAMWLAMAGVEVGLLLALGRLSHALAVSPRVASGTLLALAAGLLLFNSLQVRA